MDRAQVIKFRSGSYEVEQGGTVVTLRWDRLGDVVKVSKHYASDEGQASHVYETASEMATQGCSPKVMFSLVA